MFATHVNFCKIKTLYESGATMNQNHQIDRSLQCFKTLSRHAMTLRFFLNAEVVMNLLHKLTQFFEAKH